MSGFPRLTPIADHRHPFQVAVLASSVVIGVVLAATNQIPKSANQNMHPVVQIAWIGLLILSGITALTGMYWPGRFMTGLRIERGGVFLLAGATSMYSIALFSTAGMQALVAGSYCTAIALGSWWRTFQIGRDLRRMKNDVAVVTAAALTKG